jgi:hypothetical protein
MVWADAAMIGTIDVVLCAVIASGGVTLNWVDQVMRWFAPRIGKSTEKAVPA